MNQKQAYRCGPDERIPEYQHDVVVGGRRLHRGMEASLTQGIGYPAGRYRFDYAEVTGGDGPILLHFFGPVRRKKQRHRMVLAAAVATVHSKTRDKEASSS